MRSQRLVPGFRVLCSAVLLALMPLALLIAGRMVEGHTRARASALLTGSFQSELGCPGDWQPECPRSWLQDADGDGLYTFATTVLPRGRYEAKVVVDGSWTESHGTDGALEGVHVPFAVDAAGSEVCFQYDPARRMLNVTVTAPGVATTSVAADSTGAAAPK